MLIQTADLSPSSPLPDATNLQVYCGLDCCLTHEVHQELQAFHNTRPEAFDIYNFERALQAPYLEIMLRGFLVDEIARRQAASELHSRIGRLQELLNEFSFAFWGRSTNPRSHQQLKQLFYDTMKLPEVWRSQKGEKKLSMNRETLENLYDHYLHARPFISCILAIRDLSKQLEVFESDIDTDHRFRASYNIAGTETGRPSSSTNAFGTGGNAQNIAPSLRYVFVADPGWKLCVIDLEQVEARDVGWFCGCLFNDWSYLDACESGDLHTNNAKRIWPERPWRGDPTHDRKLADEIFYREFTYRDMAKRGSHLSNYMGTAWTAARALKVPQNMMEDFQGRYCKGPSAAYPCIPRWWQWVAQQIQTTHSLSTPFGRKRHFFGRPDDDTTLREAIAFLPQSTTADRMNLGLWRVWHKMPQIRLLAQTYDSITFQFPETANADSIVQQALELIWVEFRHPNGRVYAVPGEAKIGWNWGYYNDDPKKGRLNPEGLWKWTLGKPDPRIRAVGLERIMQ